MWIGLRKQRVLWSNEYSFGVHNPGNVHSSGPLCRPRPLEKSQQRCCSALEGSRKSTPRKCNWETLRGNERCYLLPTGNTPCQVTGRWALAGTATTLCYLRISRARGKALGKRTDQPSASFAGSGWHKLATVGSGTWWPRTERQRSHGARAWCRGRGKKLQSAPSQQQAASTFHMTQLATPSEQINNGIFWRQAGKCCWLGTAPHVKIQRCYLCGKQHPCLALSRQREQMRDAFQTAVTKSHASHRSVDLLRSGML